MTIQEDHSQAIRTGIVKVPLRTGPPTKEELIVHYPARFTWKDLKTFVNSGDLGLLKRDPKLQKRYNQWAVGIKEQYGSVVDYLQNYRLQWGRPDTLSLLPSALDQFPNTSTPSALELTTSDTVPPYFTAEIPAAYISIIQNDWPYSVPADVEHSLIWSRVPVFHPDLIPDVIAARVEQDGLWGFTGNEQPPPSPSGLTECIPKLADWGVTMESLVRSTRGTEEEEDMVRGAGREVHGFVKRRWSEREWETAWFVNPPRLQSVLGLAHIHVFARKKTDRTE